MDFSLQLQTQYHAIQYLSLTEATVALEARLNLMIQILIPTTEIPLWLNSRIVIARSVKKI